MNLSRALTFILTAMTAIAIIMPPAVAQKAPAKPTTKKATKKAPATRKNTATAKKTPAKRATSSRKAAPKKAAKKKSKAKAPSACAGLAKSACTSKSQCGWIVPKKKVSSNGRKLTAYCRKTAGIAAKKK